MDRVIVITIIVCITLVILAFMNAVDKAIQRKEVMKKLDKFGKAFGEKKKEEK